MQGYTSAFDCSQNKKGWIHVGLSLATYNAGIENVIHRTVLVGLVCTMFGLIGQMVHVAHRLKGASANLSMETLREISALIEIHARAGELDKAASGFEKLRAEIVQVQQHLATGQNAAWKPGNRSMAMKNPANPLILVADDDVTIRVIARECLEEPGFRVAEAENGQEAIERFTRTRPDPGVRISRLLYSI